MEICINCLINDVDPFELSSSVAERGKNAGRETWQNSLDAAKRKRVLKPDQRQNARDYFADFGAWDDDEINGWTHKELDALVLQYAAGDLRELQSLCAGDGPGDIDWTKAERLAERGTVSGNLFVHRGRLYISLSN